MGKKQSNEMPKNITRPLPPPGPPGRTFKAGCFGGEIETKESIQARHDYEVYMRGWRDGFAARCGNTK